MKVWKAMCFVAISFVMFSGCSQSEKGKASWAELNKKTADLFNEGKYSEAIETGNKALKIAEQESGPDQQINIATSLYNIASCYFIQGMYDKAEPLFEKALKIHLQSKGINNPTVANILKAQGAIYFAQNKFSESKDKYTNALAVYTALYGANYSSNPDILTNLGKISHIQCKFDNSIKLYELALKMNPDNEQFKKYLNEVKTDQQNINEIIMDFQEKILLNPENHILQWRLGNLFICNSQPEKAVEHYEAALSIKPDYLDALVDSAALYIEQKQYDKALTAYTKAYDQTKNRPEIVLGLATTYALKNSTEESLNWIKKLIGLGYKNWQRLETDKNLETLRASSEFQDIINKLKG